MPEESNWPQFSSCRQEHEAFPGPYLLSDSNHQQQWFLNRVCTSEQTFVLSWVLLLEVIGLTTVLVLVVSTFLSGFLKVSPPPFVTNLLFTLSPPIDEARSHSKLCITLNGSCFHQAPETLTAREENLQAQEHHSALSPDLRLDNLESVGQDAMLLSNSHCLEEELQVLHDRNFPCSETGDLHEQLIEKRVDGGK